MRVPWFSRKAQTALAALGGASVILSACGGEATPTHPAPTATRPAAPTATAAPGATAPAATATPVRAVPTATLAPPPPSPTAATGGKERYGGRINLFMDPTKNVGWTPGPFENIGLGRGGTFTSALARESLLMYDPYQNPPSTVLAGKLAQSWSFNQDLTQLTLKLRPSVTWSDGKPFTSKDVAFTFNTLLSLPPGWSSLVARTIQNAVSRVETPDPQTVVFVLKVPSVSFIANLTLGEGNMNMWPAHLSLEDSYRTEKMVGTGPYTLKELKKEISTTFVRRNDYWDTDGFGNRLPYLDSITMFYLEDGNTIFAAMVAGQLDLLHMQAGFVIRGRKEEIEKRLPGAQFYRRMGGNIGISLANRPPFTDKRVRQAVDIAFDRLAHVIFDPQGEGLIDYLGVHPPSNGGKWGYSSTEIMSFPGRRYVEKATGKLETDWQRLFANPDKYQKDPGDIAKAKQLLKDAGFDNLPFDTMLTSVNWSRGAESAVATFSRDFGKSIKLQVLDEATHATRVRPASGETGNYTIDHFPLTSGTPDDPSLPLQVIFNCSRTCHGFDQTQFTALWSEQDRTLDQAKRNQLVKQIEDLLRDEAYFVFGYSTFGWSGVWLPYVKDVPIPTVSQSNVHHLERVWVDKTLKR